MLQEAGRQVIAVDMEAGNGVLAIDDDAAMKESIAGASVIMLCIPANATLTQGPRLAEMAGPNSVMVDIASVKADVVNMWTQLCERHSIGAVSIHPMFAPSVPVHRRNTIAIPITGGEAEHRFIDFLRAGGSSIHVMGVESHDRMTAVTQAACHAALFAFLHTAASSGITVQEFRQAETPISRALLSMATRFLNVDQRLSLSIQRAGQSRGSERLSSAIAQLDEVTATNDQAAWESSLAELREWVGEESEECLRVAAQIASLGEQEAELTQAP
ncbi:MAG: prephenate dehydrogenase/arogenate dehydrogenase family protein [Planctomycetota bacterium]